MAKLTPSQVARRDRIEGLIAFAAPFLDAVLGVGERISRIAEPTDHDYHPVRADDQRPMTDGRDPGAPGRPR